MLPRGSAQPPPEWLLVTHAQQDYVLPYCSRRVISSCLSKMPEGGDLAHAVAEQG